MFNVRRITLPKVVVPFPQGPPKTRVRQGVLGDVGDHSWEGCGPFSLVGPAPNPCRPALRQTLTISQPPPLGRTNPSVSPTGRPGLGSGPGCPKVPPTWSLQQRMVLPRQPPELWRCRGNPRCGCILSCLAQSPGLEAAPHTSLFLLPRSRCQSLGSGGFPFLHPPCSSGPPTDVPQPPAV